MRIKEKNYSENIIDELLLTSSEPRGKDRLEGNLIEIKISSRGRGKAEHQELAIYIRDMLGFIQDELAGDLM